MVAFNARTNSLSTITTFEALAVYVGEIGASINNGKFRLDGSGDTVPFHRCDKIFAGDGNSYFQIVMFIPCASNYGQISGYEWEKIKANPDNAVVPNAFLYSV